MPENKELIWKNSLKAFLLLISGAFIFILFITIFPILGSLWLADFPLWRVVKENFALFVPLSAFSLFVSPVLGFASTIFTHKRKLRLMLIGIFAYWIAVLFIILVFSNFSVLNEKLYNVFLLTVWSIFAYFFFSLPILIPAILIFEKWTNPPSEIKEIQLQE